MLISLEQSDNRNGAARAQEYTSQDDIAAAALLLKTRFFLSALMHSVQMAISEAAKSGAARIAPPLPAVGA